MKKKNEIQLTKNKMDLNNRKMTNHPPSPEMKNAVNNFSAVYDERQNFQKMPNAK